MTFFRLLKGEFKKMAKPRSLAILAIILVISLILMIFVFSLFASFNASPEENGEFVFGPTEWNVKLFGDEAETKLALETAKEEIRKLEAAKTENPDLYYTNLDEIYRLKATLKAVEFVVENNLYGQDIPLYMGESGTIFNAAVGKPSGYDFTEFAVSVLQLVVTVYLITVAAGVLVNELKSGSVKLLMLRPVSRNEVTSAKLAATAIYGTVLYSLCILIAFSYGAIRYGAARVPTLYVFNAASAFLADRGFSLFLTWLSGVVTMLSFALLAYAVGLIFKSAAAGMGAAIVSCFGLLQLLFNLFGGGRFLLSYQGNFNDYFAVGNMSLYGGSDFFLMLGMLAVYWILMLAVSYAVFDKRDVV